MSQIYDNWERLVAAVLKREQLWQLFHDNSRSPSILSEASDFYSSFSTDSHFKDLAFDSRRLSSSSHSQRETPKLVLISDFFPPVDVDDIRFASLDELGTGTFGSAFTAAMDDGTKIFVKRLKTNISESEFKRHVEILGNIRHENVSALRAYYTSKEKRLLLYDYFTNGSVFALLHGKNAPAFVTFDIRLKIAVAAARGISKIHAQYRGKLVHGNVKSSNIFLDSQFDARVSDLGLASLIATEFRPTARCYAPELNRKTKNVSQASDVYSFGILLLELLTRKPTVQVPGGPQAIDLVYLIGMKCIAKSPKERPKMANVVKMLEDLLLNIGNIIPSRRELQLVDNVITSHLDNMITHAEFLGKGSFGTTSCTMLENANIVIMKRLSRRVYASFKELREHMDVITRLKHENVAELNAYYVVRDEVILVYDYQYQGNVYSLFEEKESSYSLLHGKILVSSFVETLLGGKENPVHSPLDWEACLRIALGAAKGLAYIHTQDNGNLVHGNIKASNIFLNRKNFGLVSDTGLAKLSVPVRRPDALNPGYWAPEVQDTTGSSQASDVYSFGVLLLEVLTGKPSEVRKDDGTVNSLVNWVGHVIRVDPNADNFYVGLSRNDDDRERMRMRRVLELAMNCAAKEPESRPKMSLVVRILERIYSVGRRNCRLRLEDML